MFVRFGDDQIRWVRDVPGRPRWQGRMEQWCRMYITVSSMTLPFFSRGILDQRNI